MKQKRIILFTSGFIVLGIIIGTVLSRFTLKDAIARRDLSQVRFVRMIRPNICKSTDRKEIPLLLAADAGSVSIAKFLVDDGCKVTTADKNNFTPLMAAAFNGHREMIRFLLEQGSDIDIRNSKGMTPLIVAAAQGNGEAIKILLTSNADSRIQDNNERDALFYAKAALRLRSNQNNKVLQEAISLLQEKSLIVNDTTSH